jgi:hypothetical protein
MGVDAQQCVKLTITNRSIGLIVLITQCSSLLFPCRRQRAESTFSSPSLLCERGLDMTSIVTVFYRPGGYSEVTPPDPIPNSVVNRLSANGTLS